MTRAPGHAAVATGSGGARHLLEDSLERSGFWPALAAAAATAEHDDPVDMPIVVLVAMRQRFASSPAGADPAVLDALVDVLAEAGYTNVTLGATTADDDRWLAHRDPVVVADLVGFRFVTDAGNMYDVVNLADELSPAPMPLESSLEGTELPARWLDAAFRIDVAAAATDEVYGYALCLHNLLGLLPLRDVAYHYEARRDAAEVVCDLLRHVPPHFNVVTAVTGSHGRAGTTRPQALATGTIVAGDDTLLCDWVAAAKLGADPGLSPLNARALSTFGLPLPASIEGDLTTFEGWTNPHPLDLHANRRARRALTFARTAPTLGARVDTELFPYQSAIAGRAGRAYSSLAGAADRNPLLLAASVWMNLGVAGAREALEAWNTLYGKQRVRRREVSLGLDLDQYELADYEALVGYLAPLERLIAASEPGPGGLRWRYLEGSVLFSMSRDVAVRFDDFVERVDVARAITMMADYLGGRSVAVAHDDRGRVTHQAERNLYLPQPNYLALYGGDVIDVAKIEHVRYDDREHKIFWRTVKSPNDSAAYDDGVVAFTAIDDNATRVSVMGRQQFTLPLFWQVFDLDLWPELKDPLVTDAYLTYFDKTLDNFLARYEGRHEPVGRPWVERAGETDDPDDPDDPDDALAELTGGLRQRFDEIGDRLRPRSMIDALGDVVPGRRATRPQPGTIDLDGFVHVDGRVAGDREGRGERLGFARFLDNGIRAARPVTEFWTELAQAAGRDLGVGLDT